MLRGTVDFFHYSEGEMDLTCNASYGSRFSSSATEVRVLAIVLSRLVLTGTKARITSAENYKGR